MRISKAALIRSWLWTTGLAVSVFAILAFLDTRLKAMCGVGTADMQSLVSAAQFRAAFWAWAPEPYAIRAGFDLGLDYLLMPLYAVSFYFSGVLLADALAPRGLFRRLVLMAAMIPLAGALCDAVENALQVTMLLNGPTDDLARLAYTAGNAKYAALVVGMTLLLGAIIAQLDQRRRRRRAKAVSL